MDCRTTNEGATVELGPVRPGEDLDWDSLAAYLLGRFGQPSEIVGPMLLASDAGSFTTGALLTVDGGVSAASTFWEDA